MNNQQKALKSGDEIELTIDTLAFGGEGIGRTLSNEKPFTIFVEETVPEDMVKVRLTRKKKNWGQGFVKEILKPSKLRIQPRCRHFGSAFETKNELDLKALVPGKPVLQGGNKVLTAAYSEICEDQNFISNEARWAPQEQAKGCGGCTWQFLSYEQQLVYKEKQVREAMKHIGGIEKNVVLPILGMKEPWFYRNKMEFSFSTTESGEIALGLHLKKRHYDVIHLTECFLLGPYVGDLVASARNFFQTLDQQGRIHNEIKLQSLTLREGKNTGEIMLVLSAENGEAIFLEDFKNWAVAFFQEKKLPLTSLSFIHILNKPGQRKTAHEQLLYGKATILEELRLKDGKALRFEISPLAFFQPNTKQAEILYQKTFEAAQLSGDEVLYDLFCGTGTIGIFCSQKARKVYGIELNASAIENARANASLNAIKNIEFFVGDVDKNLPKIQEKPDVVIVDPPRNGLEPKVIEKIIAFRPQRIVYVSCNPATLARDIKIFGQSQYILQSVQPVDMFPQTYHIENVAVLKL